MHTGVVTQETFADILRAISQRRRQGVLEIATGDGTFKVFFVQGRITEVSSPGMTSIQDTVAWLTTCGYPCGPWEAYVETTYSELFERLRDEFSTAAKFSTELLKFSIKHRVLERLITLRFGGGALYNFKVQLVEADRDYHPSVSVGQLLLDMVEMEGEREPFALTFPSGTVVRSVGNALSNLSEDEQRLLACIESAGTPIEQLLKRSLLSSHAFRHGLLELHAHGVIAVSAGHKSSQDPQAKAGAVAGAAIANFLSDSIDAAFGAGSAFDEAPQVALAAVAEQQPVSIARIEAEELAELETDIATPRGIRVWLAPLSVELLQSTLVPGVIATAFLILALVVPFVSWLELLSQFAEP